MDNDADATFDLLETTALEDVESQAPTETDPKPEVFENKHVQRKKEKVRRPKLKNNHSKKEKVPDIKEPDVVVNTYAIMFKFLAKAKMALLRTKPLKGVLYLYETDKEKHVLEDAALVLRTQGMTVTGKKLKADEANANDKYLLEDLQRHKKVLTNTEDIAIALQGYLKGTGREVVIYGKESTKVKISVMNVYDLKEALQ